MLLAKEPRNLRSALRILLVILTLVIASISFGQSVSGVSLNPTTVVGGASSTGTVTLTSAAPSGGYVVNLTSQIPSYVSVPSSVTIPSGATTATFTATTNPFRQTYTDTIKASDNTSSATATLTVEGDGIASLTLNPTSVAGGSSSTGTITLTSAAPTGGWPVNLTSQLPSYVSVPAVVTIAAGATSATFTATTQPFRQTYTSVITASYAHSQQTATLTVIDDSISSVGLSPSSLTGGSSSTGTVNLLMAAPTGGWTVNLASQIPGYVSVPASITIPAGSTSGTFTATTLPFRQTFTNVITATDATSKKSATLTVVGDGIASVGLSPSTVPGGTSSTGTVTLSAAAPAGGWPVNLTSQIPGYVGVPSSVTVAEGATTATFNITTKPFRTTYTNAITASYAGSKQTATLTVNGISVSTLTLSPMTVPGGTSSTGTVTLTSAAPTGGWVVTLTSQIPSYVSVPATVTVPAGSTTANFTATTTPFRQTYTNTIKASVVNLGVSQTLTVLGTSLSSVTLNPNPVTGSFSTTGTVNLVGLAPAGGWTVTLTSQFPSQVTVPASIKIPAGAGSGTFTVTTTAFHQIYTDIITAKDSVSTKSGTLTVQIGLANTAWAKFRGDYLNNGASSGSGSTGVQQWKYTTAGSIMSSPALGPDGTVYVGSGDKNVYAISGGTLKWTYVTGGVVNSVPAVGSNGLVYVGSGDDNLYALDAQTGALVWSFTSGGVVDSSPTIGFDGTVYFASEDKSVYAINGQTGAMIWKATTGGGIFSSPALGIDGTVYVGSSDNKLYALNGATGATSWTYTTGAAISSSPAIGADGTVYVGSQDSKLYAITSAGALKWSYTAGGILNSSPAISAANGTVYIGSNDKNVYAINGSTGALVWKYLTTGTVSSSPAVGSDGNVYIGSTNKDVFSLNGATGTPVWVYVTDGAVVSSPALGSDGTVYIGSENGSLYALR